MCSRRKLLNDSAGPTNHFAGFLLRCAPEKPVSSSVMWSMKIILKQVTIIVGTIVFVLIAVTCTAFLYNYHMFPLAKLKKSIEISDQYHDVKKKFDNYYNTYKKSDKIFYNHENSELNLYHESIFDDCKLEVKFNPQGKVNKIVYIGD